MSAQPAGVLPPIAAGGTEPPPDSSDPSDQAAMLLTLLLLVVAVLVICARSGCVVWPTFSSSVIRESRSSPRCAAGSGGSRYGKPCALMTTAGGVLGACRSGSSCVLVSWSVTVSAFSAVWSASVVTSTVRTAPDGVPAGNSTVPLTGV